MNFDYSRSLFSRAEKVLPKGVNSPVRYYEPYPFFVSSGIGSKIITQDHQTLIDYCLGYGALILGHSYKGVMGRIKEQLDRGSLFCIPTEKEVQLAEVLSKIVPCCEMARIVNTGSEATMHAIRLARAYTQKKIIVKFDGSYHGAYDEVLVKAGSGATLSTSGESMPESRNTEVLPFNNIEILKEKIEDEKKGEDVACIIMEPICANVGVILPETNFLYEIRKLTKKHNIVLIFDEVITGFRLALGGASEFFGIKPDIATFAKALGNGFPISAICGKKEIMSQLAPSGSVYQASTYAGNPVSVTASLATIETLIEAKNTLYPKLGKNCDRIVDAIKDFIKEKGIDATVNAIGSMYQVFFSKNKVVNYQDALKSDLGMFKKLYFELLKKDIFIPPSQFETCFLSFSHTEEDVDKTIDAYGEAISILKK